MHQATLNSIALYFMLDWLKNQCVPVGPENLALAARIMRAARVTQREACAFLANPCEERIAFCFVQDLLQHQKGPSGPENKVLVEKIAKIAKVDTNVAETFLTHIEKKQHVIV